MSSEIKLAASKADLAQRPRSSLAVFLFDRSLICTALIALSAAVLASQAPFAQAEDQTAMRQVPFKEEQRFIIESGLAMSKMSLAMTADRTGDVDGDFVAMMIPHHQGAIDLAHAELKYGHNETLRQLARDIIANQQGEMSVMRGAVGETPAQSSDARLMESAPGHATSGKSGKE
jgi:uncharacterized protein (DUF305 family)